MPAAFKKDVSGSRVKVIWTALLGATPVWPLAGLVVLTEKVGRVSGLLGVVGQAANATDKLARTSARSALARDFASMPDKGASQAARQQRSNGRRPL
jgi:hypothetical protein